MGEDKGILDKIFGRNRCFRRSEILFVTKYASLQLARVCKVGDYKSCKNIANHVKIANLYVDQDIKNDGDGDHSILTETFIFKL